jgi:hypothetical protein
MIGAGELIGGDYHLSEQPSTRGVENLVVTPVNTPGVTLVAMPVAISVAVL